MISARALGDELNRLLATETRTLARHLEGAPPYISAATFRVWREIKAMAARSLDHARTLSELLLALELPEESMPFSSDVARFHDTSVETLLPELIAEKERQVAAYRRAIEHARGDDRVRATLQTLLDENLSQLETLRQAKRTLTGEDAAAATR